MGSRSPFDSGARCAKGCPGWLYPMPYSPGRWYGPRDATLFCHACGTGRVGTAAETRAVRRADAAFERYEASGLSQEAWLADESRRAAKRSAAAAQANLTRLARLSPEEQERRLKAMPQERRDRAVLALANQPRRLL